MNESDKLERDVFVKPRDSHQCLNHSSCHPRGSKISVPYAQALLKMAFRKPKSLADYLVQAKVSRGCGEDSQKGTYRCGSRRCEVYDYLDERDRKGIYILLIIASIVTRATWSTC